jgi:hypothetical protein
MGIYEHITTFAGFPVAEFRLDQPAPADPGGVALRLSLDHDDEHRFDRLVEAVAGAPWADQVQAVIIGEWGDSFEATIPIEPLIAAADRLPALRALFLAELTSEENEISWIQSTDVTPLLQAYPRLEVLRCRGSEGLEIQPGRYPTLREFAIESGGLPASIVGAVGDCDLPNLEHLELWLGTDNYGGDATAEDLTAILTGARLPALRYLGLRDAEIADQVAAALAGAPVVARLSTLDLSLGMLSDVGAAALLSGQPLTHLRRLDLHHHFITEDMMARLREELEPAGVDLDLSEAGDEEDEDERYIAVSE